MRNQPFSEFAQPEYGAAPEDPRRRPVLLGLMIVACLLVIGARVVHVQAILAPRFLEPWDELIIKEEPIPSRDGRILSRDGAVLALDESRYDIAVDYRWLEDPPHPDWLRQQIARQLSRQERRDPARRHAAEEQMTLRREQLLENLAAVCELKPPALVAKFAQVQQRIETMRSAVERKRLERHAQEVPPKLDWSSDWQAISQSLIRELTTSPDRFRNDPIILKEELVDHVIVEDVPLKVVAAIQSQPGSFPGVQVRATSTRAYPHGTLAAHLIGVRRLQGEPIAGLRREGVSGIERLRTDILSGSNGIMKLLHNHRGERIDRELKLPPQDGRDVILTIDARLQKLAEDLLDDATRQNDAAGRSASDVPQGATLIAMDIWTGELLALAATPRPSLSILVHPRVDEWQQLQSDPRRPLFPRATRAAFPPGSLFQVITAIAAFESGVVSPSEQIAPRLDDTSENAERRRSMVNETNFIPLTIEDALAQSSNPCFVELGRRLEPEVLHDWAARFGFGEATGIEVSGESRGNLPILKARSGNDDSSGTSTGATVQMAIGQGSLLVTPLQVVRMMAAVANGGYLVTPRVIHRLPQSSGASDAPAAVRIPGLHAETLAAIRTGLQQAIVAPDGTGQAAQVEMMSLAGKTGTAEVQDDFPHAWFSGYAPVENPRVAFVIMVEHGGDGALVGPLAGSLVTELLGLGYLRPAIPDARQTQASSAPVTPTATLPTDY